MATSSREERRWRGQPLHRRHRSRLGAGEDGEAERLRRTSSTAIPPSAAAIRCCRISAWSPPPPWAWTSRGSATRHAASCAPALPARRRPPIPAAARRRARRAAAKRARQDDHHRLAAARQPRAWLEQLIAEITGKQGKGIVPVDAEPLGEPARLWPRPPVRLHRLDGETTRRTTSSMALGEGRPAGDPHHARRPEQLGQEFFRWEVAIAVGRRGDRHRPVRPARRRGQQGQDPRAHRRLSRRTARTAPSSRCSRTTASRCYADAANAQPRWRGATTLGAKPEGASRSRRRRRLRRPARLPRRAATSTRRCCRRCARRARRTPRGHRAWASGRASCTPPARPTRAGRTAASSSRSPATTRTTCVPGRKLTFGVVEAAQAQGDFDVLRRARPPRAARPSRRTSASGLRRPCGTPSQKPCSRIESCSSASSAWAGWAATSPAG